MTTQVAGVDVVVAAYQETTFGVDPSPTPSGRLVYFSSLNLAANQNMIDSTIMAAGRGTPRPSRGNIAVSGNLDTTLAPTSLGWWLKQILGDPTTTGETAPYTHVFKPAALLPGFIIERDFTDIIANKVDKFNGLRVASASFGFPQEGAATLSMTLAGKKYSIGTAPLDAILSDPGHTEWSGFQGVVKQGGSVVGGIMSAQLQIDNELNTDTYCFPGTGETAGLVYALREGRAKISGTVELVFKDFTLLDLAAAGTPTSFEWIYTHGSGAGTAGNEQASFKVTDCDIPLTTPVIDTPSGMRLSVPFTAYQDGTDLGVEVTLKNAIAKADL